MPVDAEDVIALGDDLMRRYPGTFSSQFNENKHRVDRLTELQSRHVRNRVAGYITRNCSSEDSTVDQ